MTVAWAVLLVLGVAAAALASRRAVSCALEMSEAIGISSGLVGLTILAIGTDLPEIANSVSASLRQHGDLNVGDSAGSALAQITLVLAVLMLASGRRLDLSRSGSSIAISAGAATVVALVLLAVLLSDRVLSRVDGAILVGCWVASVVLVHRREGEAIAVPERGSGVGAAALRTLVWLALVGASATLVVAAFVELSDRFGVPEFIASALVLSIGTSMPELVVDWTAIRRGASALAIGDLFGSSLVDATLSVGIGPIVRATPVSPATVDGVLLIAVGCAMATALVVYGGPARRTALALLGVYAASSVALVAIAA